MRNCIAAAAAATNVFSFNYYLKNNVFSRNILAKFLRKRTKHSLQFLECEEFFFFKYFFFINEIIIIKKLR